MANEYGSDNLASPSEGASFPLLRIEVGIELGRVSCRWGVTVLALSIARRVHIPTMTTFTEAPLQSRKVEFLDSGFRLGFPREAFPRHAKLKRSLAFTPTIPVYLSTRP
jgi:hypothetical protein